jgi:hypothetical protein
MAVALWDHQRPFTVSGGLTTNRNACSQPPPSGRVITSNYYYYFGSSLQQSLVSGLTFGNKSYQIADWYPKFCRPGSYHALISFSAKWPWQEPPSSRMPAGGRTSSATEMCALSVSLFESRP